MADYEEKWYREERVKRLSEFFNTILFDTPSGNRFTQDSPIMGNVWLQYALNPLEPVDLILSVEPDKSSGEAALELRRMISKLRVGEDADTKDRGNKPLPPDRQCQAAPSLGEKQQETKLPPRISFIPGQVAVTLYFDELMRIVLPLTPWWKRELHNLESLNHYFDDFSESRSLPKWSHFPIKTSQTEDLLLLGLMNLRNELSPEILETLPHQTGLLYESRSDYAPEQRDLEYIKGLPFSFLWMIRIAGLVAHLARLSKPSRFKISAKKQLEELLDDNVLESFQLDLEHRRFDEHGSTIAPFDESSEEEQESNSKYSNVKVFLEEARNARLELIEKFFAIYKNWKPESQPELQPDEHFIWRVTTNRKVEFAVQESAKTIKADAARRVFETSCEGITWAVIDSGIDASHPAFKDHDSDNGASRVIKTLDFTFLRSLLDLDVLEMTNYLNSEDASSQNSSRSTALKRRFTQQEIKTLERASRELSDKLEQQVIKQDPEIREFLETCDDESKKRKVIARKVNQHLRSLRRRIVTGRDIDWEILEGFIETPEPKPPKNDHGTHVAGILGADWVDERRSSKRTSDASEVKRRDSGITDEVPRKMVGIAPKIKLIDCRILADDGSSNEFEVLAAIQFLRWMNSRAGQIKVHGANLSLSLIHQVQRYACGKTPICVECDESVALGMVIVVAAGNRGCDSDGQAGASQFADYQPISITDPGNAASVITVGATHRKKPHEYGISYFSSRGPTGDGRTKPDLVAPGEKIDGPSLNGGSAVKDGTSMAAPHVSGAAAMLMARHKELIGNPRRIKQVLCETATDLERQNYFQGHGLVDILRALQSV